MPCKSRCYKNLDRRIKNIEKDIELKYKDFSVAGGAISGSSTFTTIVPATITFTAIDQGIDQGERIGQSINLTSLQLRMFFNNYETTFGADPYVNIRVLIFWWKDYIDNTYPDLEEILTPPPVSNSINNVHALYNFQNRASYKILYDNIFDLSSFAVNIDTTPDSYWNPGKGTHTLDLRIPLNSTEIIYGDGGTIPNQPFNKDLLMYIYSDSTVAPHPTLHYNARVYYKDA